jgi:hypothetical protein
MDQVKTMLSKIKHGAQGCVEKIKKTTHHGAQEVQETIKESTSNLMGQEAPEIDASKAAASETEKTLTEQAESASKKCESAAQSSSSEKAAKTLAQNAASVDKGKSGTVQSMAKNVAE